MTEKLQARLAKLNAYLRMESVSTLDEWDRGYYAAVKEEARFLRSLLYDGPPKKSKNLAPDGCDAYQKSCESSPTFNEEVDSGLHQ